MITRIFIDLDDVLNAFTMSALEYAGCNCGPFDFEMYNPEWEFDIVKAANNLQDIHTFTLQSFWRELDAEFWENVIQSVECHAIIEECERSVGGDCIFILSASDPSRVGSHASAAKQNWVRKNLPHWLEDRLIITHYKYLLANEESLLIDDSTRNCYAFCEHGGNAIILPRPWNIHHNLHTMDYFNTMMTKLFG